MPYVLLPKDDTREGSEIDYYKLMSWGEPDPFDPAAPIATPPPMFEARQDAHKTATRDQRVVYVPTHEERNAWQTRERSRFRDHVYEHVPWAQTYEARHDYSQHYAHMALGSKGMIAYTPSDEHGYQDRQIRVRPGKYLEQFYTDTPPAEKQRWIDLVTVGTDPDLSFAVATTADDIEMAYTHDKLGSCMSGSVSDNDWTDDTHPVRAYGESDLALAYLGPLSDISARAVIWPAKQRFYRVYGTYTLQRLLIAAGYSEGDFRGARIKAIPHYNGGYVVPYVDGVSSGRRTGDGWIVLGSGEIQLHRTDGRSQSDESNCERCDSEIPCDDRLCESCEELRETCGHCDEEFFTSDGDSYCRDCTRSLRGTCAECGEDTWEDMYRSHAHDGDHVCEDCAAGDAVSCVVCLTSFAEQKYPYREQISRAHSGYTDRVCTDCADDDLIALCHACDGAAARMSDDDPFPPCNKCGISLPRCEDTGDVLAAGSSDDQPAVQTPDILASFAVVPMDPPADLDPVAACLARLRREELTERAAAIAGGAATNGCQCDACDQDRANMANGATETGMGIGGRITRAWDDARGGR